jgi:nucleoside-diphosphate kinase
MYSGWRPAFEESCFLHESEADFWVVLMAPQTAVSMASLRLLAFCSLLSTALSFVALGPGTLASSLPTSQSVHARVPARTFQPSSRRAGRLFMATPMERTYIMIKPDGVQRGLVSDIVRRFEQRGFKLVALKLTQPSKALLEEHYGQLKTKPFFPKLITYMTSGPVVAMVWEGRDVVATGRKMLGATNPLESVPGTIRGDYAIEVGRNICHGSDSVESADREIKLWFSPAEVIDWGSHSHDWIYE